MAEKYSFDTSFQEEGLRFILNNPDGVELMGVVDSSYFTLIEHSVIFQAIANFHKGHGRVPSKPFLRETLSGMFKTAEYQTAITAQDERFILDNLLEDLYGSPAKDGDILLERFHKFAAYVDINSLNENTDFEDFSNYERYAQEVYKIIDSGSPRNVRESGIFLVKGIKERQMRRQAEDLVVPSPYHQLNALTSAGGFEPGSIIVLLDRPKKLKTTFLVNTARKYMAAKKKVLYIDLENGEDSIASRLEQSVGRVTKKDIIKGTKDKEIQKVLRRYKRLGGEVYVKRLPAFSSAADIQKIIDTLYRKEGILFGALMIDYLALMGSVSGKRDDFERISDAYLDISNLMMRNPTISHCWTANHVQRNSRKRESTRYMEDDIAKCIDIVRHVNGIFGLNRTPVEFENGLVRLEVVSQREGVPFGRAYFRADPLTQRIDELTKREVEELKATGILYDPENTPEEEPEDERRSRGDI